tara:strand:+ start:52 stop:648 length:597 start_codon:yes stop_codon:yes gene_type:complete
MAVQFTISNLFQLFSAISPFFVAMFLIMASVFNGDVKGMVYLGGVLIASVINLFVMNLIRSPISLDASPVCNILELPYFNVSMYNSPAFNSTFLGFTAAYLIMPMFSNDGGSANINYGVIIMLLSLFMVDAVSKVTNKCTNPSGVVFGGILGSIIGFMWFNMLNTATTKNLLYFNSFVSNKQYCERPVKQQFVCRTKK